MKRQGSSLHHPAAPVSELLLQQQQNESDRHDSQHDRKRQKRQKKNGNEEDMLIFGYEARIFNDKEKAKKIEKGHYLIPWKSCEDTRYKMDRYDVRHMIEDLSKELVHGHTVTTANFATEKDQEELYNKERYADLDSEEEMLFDMSEDEREAYVDEKRREQEKKEQESKFQAFDYDGKNKEEQKDRSDIQKDIASEYKAPEDMIVPSTREQASIISDTAKAASASVNPNLFEIKTHARQANNPLYAFLSKRHELYPFYKHLSWLLSSGLGAYGDSSDSEDESEDEKQENNIRHHDINSNSIQKEKEDMSPQMDQDISNVIEKTARFVARSGPELEQKIRQRHAHDRKFTFLYRNNQHHEYYQSRINYFKANPDA